jgi:uncharacterized protein
VSNDPAPERPLAPADCDTRGWWDATRRHELVVQRCDSCGHAQHYPRAICTTCGGSELSLQLTQGRGEVETFTVVHRAPNPAFTAPYTVAFVRLLEGPVFMTNIVGCAVDDVRIGLKVSVQWEPHPDGRNIPVFTPEGGQHGFPADR